MNANQMLAKALDRTHASSDYASAVAAQLRSHIEHMIEHGGSTGTVSAHLTAALSEAQAKRNANADMCLLIGATQEQVDIALGADDDAFYDMFDALRAAT